MDPLTQGALGASLPQSCSTRQHLRVAWNNVSVVDPLFTVPLLSLVTIGLLARRQLFTHIGLAWAIAYLILGAVQRDRAEAVGEMIAEQGGHEPVRLEAKPGFANREPTDERVRRMMEMVFN